MTDPDSGREQALLRETFRRHEHLAEGAGQRLLPVVRERASHRRIGPQWIVVAVLVLVAAGAVPAAFAVFGRGPVAPVAVPSSGSGLTFHPAPGVAPTAPAGWRWESSLGMQALVPVSWSINDFGCNMTDAPSVVRGTGAATDCYTPEPVDKELVIFQRADAGLVDESLPGLAGLPADTPATHDVIDGHQAVRSVGQRPDGRAAGVVAVPDRGVELIVRAHSTQTVSTVLDSLQIVDVDYLGCPTQLPAVSDSWASQPTSGSAGLRDAAPGPIVLCTYAASGSAGSPELAASGQLTGEAAGRLTILLDAASSGRNPDAPEALCLPREPAPADALLLLHYRDELARPDYPYTLVRPVWVTWSGCVHRGLTDGLSESQVNQRIIAAIMTPLHSGYAFTGDLPH